MRKKGRNRRKRLRWREKKWRRKKRQRRRTKTERRKKRQSGRRREAEDDTKRGMYKQQRCQENKMLREENGENESVSIADLGELIANVERVLNTPKKFDIGGVLFKRQQRRQ